MHDTLKKPREILAVWYDVQVKLKNPTAELDIDSVDPQAIVLMLFSLDSHSYH